MTIDERANEQEWAPTNIRRLIPRVSSPLSKIERNSGPFEKRPVVVDNDDDPGPSAA